MTHYGTLVNALGDISALCFKTPAKINLRISSWTLRPESVTCQLCKTKLIKAGTLARKRRGHDIGWKDAR